MSNGRQTSKVGQHDSDFYRAFLSLARDRRRRIAYEILRNEDVLADLYDHFLIQEAMREKGRSISWKRYLRAKNSSAR